MKIILIENINKPFFLLPVIIFSSLFFRLILIPFDVPIKLDGIDYFDFAFELSKNGLFPDGILHSNDGWSIFLSPFFSLIGYDQFMNLIYAQRILSIVLSTLTIIPVYLLCRHFTTPQFSLIGSSVFAFHPRLIENSILGITEPLFILLVTLTILFAIQKNDKSFVLAFVIASFASIVRYEGLVLFIPLTIFFFVVNRNQKKHYFRYVFFIGIIFLILFPIAELRSQDSGMDGFISHVFSGLPIVYCSIQCDFSESSISDDPNYVQTKNLFSNLFFNTIKFLIWMSIPFYLILVPIGIFQFIKHKNYKFLYILLFGFFLLIPGMYAYGRDILEIRYLFVLFPILSIFSSNAFNLNKKLSKNNLILLLIPIIFGASIFYFSFYSDDYIFEKEIYLATKYLVDVADGVNIYYGNAYVKVATLENNWPNSLPLNERGRTTYFVKKISSNDAETIDEFLSISKNSGLTHLVIMEKNISPFLDDVYVNYNNYPYLKKSFDSNEFGFENKILIFEIDYSLFNDSIKN